MRDEGSLISGGWRKVGNFKAFQDLRLTGCQVKGERGEGGSFSDTWLGSQDG